jgi:hypothetical protein
VMAAGPISLGVPAACPSGGRRGSCGRTLRWLAARKAAPDCSAADENKDWRLLEVDRP